MKRFFLGALLALIAGTAQAQWTLGDFPSSNACAAAAASAVTPGGTFTCRTSVAVPGTIASAPPVTPPVDPTPPSVTALPSAFKAGAAYALEAPGDADRTSYNAKPQSNGNAVTSSYAGVPTVTRGGVVRLGPASSGALAMLRHEVRAGDPLRNGGNRAELSYDAMQIQHGVDYWMAFAIKLDADWSAANSGGSGDRQSLAQTHQQNSEASLTNGGPWGVQWVGSAGREIQVFTLGPSNSPVTRFVAAAAPGQWQRYLVHYRSGVTSSQAPVLEMWLATGSADYVKLSDLAPGSLYGDPAQKETRDWAKVGIYKWTSNSYGSTVKRGMYSSGLFFGQGVDLRAQAAASIAGYQ